MNTNRDITLEEMLEAIEGYTYLRECFSNHLKWLFEKCGEQKRHDHIYFKIATGRDSLGRLENMFEEAGRILGLDEIELHKVFDFDSASDCNDMLKLGDSLAEVRVAIELKNLGFSEIEKISARDKKFADFTAKYDNVKFAIEVKNVREREFYERLTDGIYNDEITFLGDLRGAPFGNLPTAEGESLLLSLERRLRLSEDRARIGEQLKNTVGKYNCQSTMIIISVETISFINDSPDFIDQCLSQIKAKYPIADYIACYLGGQELFTHPKLFLETT